MSAADDAALAPWMCRIAEPTAPQPAPHAAPTAPLAQSLDGLASMSWGQLRDALIAEHGARQLAELQRNAAQSAHKVEADAHTLTLDALIATRDQCDALRTAVGMAENVIATLRARVATLESLAAGPRLVIDDAAVDAIDGGAPRRVPMPCVDCRGDGVVNDAECGACGGEGCRS